MKVGIGKVDITPPVGVELAGYGPFRERKSTGIHDNLFCKALYLEDEQEKAIIVMCDLISLANKLVKETRERISKKHNIEEEKILLAGIHTHSGPETGVYIGWGEPDKEYLSKLPDLILKAAEEANENLKEVRVGIGTIEIDGEEISYNRVKEDVGVNKEIKVMKFVEKETEKPLCLILNYGAHAVVQGSANTLISRDWPGEAVDLIKKETSFETMFFQGGCGDINSKSGYPNPDEGFKEIKRIGRYFAERVIKEIDKIKVEDIKKFKNKSFKQYLPTTSIPENELKKVIEENEKILIEEEDENKKRAIKFQIEGAKAQLSFYKEKKDLYQMEIETHVIGINNAILITIPGELFVEFQRKLESSFPDKVVFTITYANGSIPYIPSKYDFQVRGYASSFTPRILGVMPFREDVGEVLVENIVDFIKNKF